jgi:hypothetical protein
MSLGIAKHHKVVLWVSPWQWGLAFVYAWPPTFHWISRDGVTWRPNRTFS